MMTDTIINTDNLIEAAFQGDAENVRKLIPVSDARTNDSIALQTAARNGHTECVKLLIPHSDPKAGNSWALQLAAAFGHTRCVALLLPVSDPKARDSEALLLAAFNGHADIVDLLWDVSDPHAVLGKLQQEHLDKHHMWAFVEQRVEAAQQHAQITSTLSNTAKPNGVRKLRPI